MKKKSPVPDIVWRLIGRMNRHMVSTYGARSKAASRVLVLTTTGRKSGRLRLTPLQYEAVDGVYYVASARGAQADWFRNIVSCPRVAVQIGVNPLLPWESR